MQLICLKLLGDVSAITSGSPKKMAKRVGRRTAGKATERANRKLTEPLWVSMRASWKTGVGMVG